ncbi:MAG: hypothetical protein ACHQIM_14285, partial [Sphingobacteriales bacterium]
LIPFIFTFSNINTQPMKKIFLLLITTILTLNIVHAQTGWINYKIDNKFSVKLPSQPGDVQGSHIARGKDSVVYIITEVDFVKVAGIDSATLVPMAPTQDFANSIKTGMLGQMPGFTLGDINVGKWNQLVSYHVEGENTEKRIKTFSFMIVQGSHFYSLTTIVPYGKDTKSKDVFFESLVLN